MAKESMRDIVVLVPGITGSILQKNGKDVWNISGQAIWSAVTSLGASLQDLELKTPDPSLAEMERMLAADKNALEDLGDGVRATGLMGDLHAVFGLIKVDGYTTPRRFIAENFDVRIGRLDDPSPANYFDFPYDWRHDNRVAAMRLKQLVNAKLPLWRKKSGAEDARVIIIGHSMGGLVARYYLEALEGWKDCRALITFGTPHRGAVNALDFLANGFRKIVDLSNLLRSMPSAYQLLPIYKVLKAQDQWVSVAEVSDLVGIDQTRTKEGLKFHRDIEEAVKEHLEQAKYRDMGYRTIPVVGIRQPTLQSAVFADGKIRASREVPGWIDARLGDGDGTVPRLSATPIELSNAFQEQFMPEQHAFLQSNPRILDELLEQLKQMQVVGLENVRLRMRAGPPLEPPGISLEAEDLYLPDEPVHLRAHVFGLKTGPKAVTATLKRVKSRAKGIVRKFKRHGDEWMLDLADLEAGFYRIEVKTDRKGPGASSPLHGAFQVVR